MESDLRQALEVIWTSSPLQDSAAHISTNTARTDELYIVPDRRALHRPNLFLQARSDGAEQILKHAVHAI